MLRLLVLLAALILAAPAAADARMPALDGITVQPGACPYYPVENGTVTSCAELHTGTLWLEPGARVGGWTYWHEMGHFFDARVLDDRTRRWMTTTLGFKPATRWWGSGRGSDLSSPGERFADAYAVCAKGTRRERAAYRQACNAITVAWLTSPQR